jgi:hypothetical protein
MNAPTIDTPPPAPVINLESAGLVWQGQSAALVIGSAADYAEHAERLKAIKSFQKRVGEFFEPLKRKASEAHKALCEAERKALQPASDDEAAIKRALVAFDQEQERLRRIEENRLREEARLKEERRRLDEAAALEREGVLTGNQELIDEADALILAPVEAPVVHLERATPKVAGIVTREVWKCEVVDLLKLVKAVAEHPQHLNLLMPNNTAIQQMAKALKGAMAIPGIRVYADTQIAAGGREPRA